jgi:hypothetical protein
MAQVIHQFALTFLATRDSKNRSEGDAAEKLNEYLVENAKHQVTAMTGNKHRLIVTFRAEGLLLNPGAKIDPW